MKELAEPVGALIWADAFQLGDPTISVMDLWGAEYQENDACLIQAADLPKVKAIGQRERCPVNHVGNITGSGKVSENLGVIKGLNSLKTLYIKLIYLRKKKKLNFASIYVL